jgi:hypothetical protein
MPETLSSLKILFVAAVCDRRIKNATLQFKFKGNFVIAFGRAAVILSRLI